MYRFRCFSLCRLAPVALLFAVLLSGCELFNNAEDSGPGDPFPQPVALPVPDGTLGVGTTTLVLADASREETYTPTIPGDARELVVQLWYPTDALPATTPAPYMAPALVDLFAAFQDYASADSLRSFLNALQTNSVADAALSASAATYPVVFFSHGLSGSRSFETTFIESLASHGYVVVGIDHTFGSFATAFPDGRVVLFSNSQPPFVRIVETWADDLSFVLDELVRLNRSDPDGRLTGRLDLTRVGAMGHSTGGSAAVQVMVEDPRFKAGISLDAPQVGDALTDGLDEPFMFMFARPSQYFDTAIQSRLRARGYTLRIDQTTHYNFTDLPLLLDLAGVSAARAAASFRPPGTLDARRNLTLLNTFTVAFFERHLLGLAVPLLDGGTSAFPEVSFEIINGVAAPVATF